LYVCTTGKPPGGHQVRPGKQHPLFECATIKLKRHSHMCWQACSRPQNAGTGPAACIHQDTHMPAANLVARVQAQTCTLEAARTRAAHTCWLACRLRRVMCRARLAATARCIAGAVAAASTPFTRFGRSSMPSCQPGPMCGAHQSEA